MLTSWRGPRAVLPMILLALATGGMTVGCGEKKRTRRPTRRKYVKSDKKKLPKEAPGELKRLFSRGGWLPADPPKNRHGMWELIHEKSKLTFIHVPGGSFMMGDDLAEDDSGHVRKITLKPFMLCKTEVNQRAWDEIGGQDDRTREGPELPINRIIWDEARAWCRSCGFRLPSEAEWEYAARAGTAETWVSGNQNSMALYAWFHDNSNNEVHPVGKKRPNKWGFHDMGGNVAEWCQDIYTDYKNAPTDGSAATSGGDKRVLRGGNYSDAVHKISSCYRDRNGPGSRYGGPGVRPAVTLR